MDLSHRPSLPSELLPAIELLLGTRLSEAKLLYPERIYVTVDDGIGKLSDQKLGARQDVWLRLMDEEPDRAQFESTARIDRKTMRYLQVSIRTQSALDVVGEHREALMKSTGAHLTLEDAVIDALDGEHVFDEDGNQMTRWPLELLKARAAETLGGDVDWVMSRLVFAVPFTRKLTQRVS